MIMQGVGNIIEFRYDAAGKRITDSAAFKLCLEKNNVCYLPPGEKLDITETLHIKDGKSVWCPGGSLATLQVKFPGLAIQMSGNTPGLHGVKLIPDDAYAGKYDGVGFGQHDEEPFNGTDHATLHDVWIYSPRIGLRLVNGECDWGDIQVAIKWFYDTGIDFRSVWDTGLVSGVLAQTFVSSSNDVVLTTSTTSRRNAVLASSRPDVIGDVLVHSHKPEFASAITNVIGVGLDHPQPKPELIAYSNNNTIRILEEIHGLATEYNHLDAKGQPARWPSRDSYGIRLGGTVNTIIGGEIAYAKYAIDDQGDQNRWIGQYVEGCGSIKVGPGTHYFDCHLALDTPPIIDPQAIVFGQSGLNYSQFCHFERPQASASKLTGLWYFDEIVHGAILDHSGRGHHLTITGSPKFAESPYGQALQQDPTNNAGTLTVPLAACVWSKPFTMVACFQVNKKDDGNILISWERERNGPYTRIVPGPGKSYLQNYTGTHPGTAVDWPSQGYSFANVSPQNTQKWCWLGMYIDPVGGKAKLLDSWRRDVASKPFLITGGGLTNPTSIYLFDSTSHGKSVGALCFLAFWQREMPLPEFIALINQRTHWKPTPRSQVAMKTLELIGDDGKGRRFLYRSAPPQGEWRLGDIVFNTNPSAGGNVGWIWVVTGPWGPREGWRPFGAIAP